MRRAYFVLTLLVTLPLAGVWAQPSCESNQDCAKGMPCVQLVEGLNRCIEPGELGPSVEMCPSGKDGVSIDCRTEDVSEPNCGGRPFDVGVLQIKGCVSDHTAQQARASIAAGQRHLADGLRTMKAPAEMIRGLSQDLEKGFRFEEYENTIAHERQYVQVLAKDVNQDQRPDFIVVNCMDSCIGSGGPNLEVFLSLKQGYKRFRLKQGRAIAYDPIASRIYTDRHGIWCGLAGIRECIFEFLITENGLTEGRKSGVSLTRWAELMIDLSDIPLLSRYVVE